MTVLIVMPVAEQRGGAELMLRHLIQYGDPTAVGWVVVFLESGPMLDEFRQLGAHVILIEAGRLRQPHRFVSAVGGIAAAARRERATVVLGWMTKGHIYGGPAALLSGRPAIWYQMGTAERHDWLARLATTLPARGVLTLSNACSRAQARLHPLRPQRLVYPGVELDRFDAKQLATPSDLRARFGLPSGGPIVGMVARLQRWKGVHVLIEAMALLRGSHPQAHCVVVGGIHNLEAGYADEVERQVEALGLATHVTFAGLQANVGEWMQAMDVVVHASDHEPFGIVVIEAMALGKPVIAGSDGGPREIVTHGIDGLLAPYGDAEALAAALRLYLDDQDFAAGVGRAARRRAADFSAQRYANNLVAALGELSDDPA